MNISPHPIYTEISENMSDVKSMRRTHTPTHSPHSTTLALIPIFNPALALRHAHLLDSSHMTTRNKHVPPPRLTILPDPPPSVLPLI
jgi:hypothetical protein